MRKNVLPITAGVVGALLLSVSTSADFTGWVMEKNPEPFDTFGHIGPDVGLVDVWNLYLVFDNLGTKKFPLTGDTLNAIFVITNPDFNSMIHSSDVNTPFDGAGGGFWNNLDDPPQNTPMVGGFFYNQDPLGFDNETFLSIGKRPGFLDADEAAFSTGAETLLNDSGIMNGSGVMVPAGDPVVNFSYFATAKDIQTFPDQDTGRLFVFQVAVLQGEHASGVWNIQWGTVDGGAGDGVQERIEWTTIPAPGAMALLGLAGLAGARRRRRG